MFTKFQIALQYFPELMDRPKVALQKLRRWIRQSEGLCEALARTGYRQQQLTFSKRQVELIYEYLGEP